MDNALGLLDFIYRLLFRISTAIPILFQELWDSEMAWHDCKYIGVGVYRNLGSIGFRRCHAVLHIPDIRVCELLS